MADIDGTLAVLAVATWADHVEGKRICVQSIDNYIRSIGGNAADKFQALEHLKNQAIPALRGIDSFEWVMNVFDTRLAELTAAMIGVGVPLVASNLAPAPESEDDPGTSHTT